MVSVFTSQNLHGGQLSPKLVDSMQLWLFPKNEFPVAQTGLLSEIGENVVSMFCFDFRLFCLIQCSWKPKISSPHIVVSINSLEIIH